MNSTTTTTAHLYVDEMNTRTVIHQQAFDEEHANSLILLLSLTEPMIRERYCIGAHETTQDSMRIIRFVDGSIAIRDRHTHRWHVAIWSEDAA